ncbi:hypothetical protein FB192DRAFT_1279383 [Mucor lusitanicus]|uniref:Polyadenylate tail-binding protein n=1 Tax=Mucor circinelloides f. lusitanicus TaxID=29924 RepID=A0A8H4BLM4_MUCCL|nr:hypothetical protein FB192DRAFT_1279383 [Mucor lusitanicus]
MNLHLATFSSRARKWVSSLIVCRCCKHASKSTWIADRAYTLLNGVTFRAGLRLQLKINPPSSDYPEPEAHAGILHIKNLPGHTNNKLLYELFRPFGPMILCKILVEHASTFKGTALVQYFNPQDAQDAESMMVKTTLLDNADTSTPPSPAPINNTASSPIRSDGSSMVDYTNLYIKNLDLNVKSVDLFNNFRRFGRIISARVMKNAQTKQSKGFGFVSFSKADEAQKAKHEMNGEFILSKPVIVAFHEPKKAREADVSVSPTQSTFNGSASHQQMHPNYYQQQQHISPPPPQYHAMNNHWSYSPHAQKQQQQQERPSFRRRGSVESMASVMTETSSQTRRQTITKAVLAVEKGNDSNLNDIVDMLLTLRKKDLATCLFNKVFLKAKIKQAKDALDIFPKEEPMPSYIQHVALPPKGSRAIPIVAPPPASTAMPTSADPKILDSNTMNAQELSEEISKFLKTLDGLPLHEKKQSLGDRLFPLVKSTGVKQAPKITIRLLDSVPLDELAYSMYDKDKLKQQVSQISATISTKY